MKHYVWKTYWDYKMVEEVLDDMEFELLVSTSEDGTMILKVHDLQGANLGDIESDEFENFDDLMDRFDIYYRDYYEDPICEEFGDEIGDWTTYEDLYNELMKLPQNRIEDWEWTINVLGLIAGVYD